MNPSPEVTGSLMHLLSAAAEAQPERPAVVDVSGDSLTHQELLEAVVDLGRQLRERGIGPLDRVATVLPDGVPAAVAFLAVASHCAAAPFNPALTADEFSATLASLRPRALLIASDGHDTVRSVARTLDIPVWVLESASGHGRGWTIAGQGVGPARHAAAAEASSTGLMLFTSGTTAKPKLVPLTQANLSASAGNIGRTLALRPEDRCLNVMPLFHIHGLVAGLLAPVAVGGSVVCAPGFSASSVPGWLESTGATWYTAVPTMHQAILANVASRSRDSALPVLRFVRSSSASLPPDVMASLEAAFRAPVIEAYGMTEASHQMASNPLPPGVRKPGTVGRPDGAGIVILSPDGSEPLPPGTVGEVAIRGAGVTAGYLDNPRANREAFSGGWFRTGDQGYFDQDGYLTLTGRLKELINRAGEKIAPREVDEALLAHPEVLQAVAFAVPDGTYGEVVGAAVVLQDGAATTVDDLRSAVARRLAPFKVPHHIVIVDDLPKGPTGKLQRRGLASAFGLAGSGPQACNRTNVDPHLLERVTAIWRDVLGTRTVAVDTDFIRAGGDSIAAVRVTNQLRDTFGVDLTPADVFAAPTVTAQAQLVARRLAP